MAQDWTEQFYGTRQLPADVRRDLRARSREVAFEHGTTVFSPGLAPDGMLFLLEGTVRVSQTSDTGREIVLYRVIAGESCVLTTACILTQEAYAAEGTAEGRVRAILLPEAAFNGLVAQYPVFRDFVFAAYARRLMDLLRVIDDVAFGRIDVRLAARILALADEQGVLGVTQMQLASELGTAREVVSRQLSEFQRRGWIVLGRGRVEILQSASLQALADMPSVPPSPAVQRS